MRDLEIKKRVAADPFKPFTIHLPDGSRYDIHDSGGLYITRTLVVIGLNPDESGIPTDSVLVDPVHITRLTPIENGSDT